MTAAWRALATMAGVAALSIPAASCSPPGSRPPDLKTFTESFAMQVTWLPFPPYAREPILFRIVIRDKKTRAPIERGEGQIYASSADGINVHDSFIPAAASGTYTARLHFITAGEWAVGIRFRKDSVSKLETPVTDFRLTVHNERQ
jgi:hypothetical protein